VSWEVNFEKGSELGGQLGGRFRMICVIALVESLSKETRDVLIDCRPLTRTPH